MKGIMILGFNENYEAFIDAQYPDDLYKNLNLNASDLTNMYTLHLSDNKNPNFFQMEIKNLNIASLFTGFSEGRYIGRPEYAIVVFLDTEEIEKNGVPKDFEGMIRRIAHLLLPKKENNLDFNEMLKDFFLMLKNQDLEPYWDEIEEYESVKLSVTPSEVIEKVNQVSIPDKIFDVEDVIKEGRIKKVVDEEKVSKEIDAESKSKIIEELEHGISEDHLEKLEKEVLEEEIEDLKIQLKEKSEKIRELTRRITEFQSDRAEIEEIKESNRPLKEKIDDITKKKEILERKITELKRGIDEKETHINSLNQEIERLKNENEEQMDRIAGLKIELRNLTIKGEKVHEDLTEELIDLKKEVKVLRRERDHYKKIVKDNDLL
ncbi:MAG: hypothetical protein ACFFAH_05580 [Promethearchaeota archaeon]